MDDVKDAFAKLREKPKPPASGTPQDMEEYLRRKRAWERQFRRSTAWETLRQLAERQKSQPPPVIPETVRKHLDSEEVREAVGKSVSEAFNRHRAVCPMCGAFNPRISFINLDGESPR